MLKMTNILEQDQREVPIFFCKILEGPTSCPCPAQRERGNGTGLVKGNRRERKQSSLKSHFVIKNQYLFINMQKTHTERADGQKCHGVKIGEGGGLVKNTKKNKVYNILTVP